LGGEGGREIKKIYKNKKIKNMSRKFKVAEKLQLLPLRSAREIPCKKPSFDMMILFRGRMGAVD
jgi:hypothetical protein